MECLALGVKKDYVSLCFFLIPMPAHTFKLTWHGPQFLSQLKGKRVNSDVLHITLFL